MEKKTFYITTPIYYPSDKLHIGHSYCTVATDAIARYKRLQGYDVMFLTGTDEHGQKIETKAEEAGMTPQAFVDRIVDGERGVRDLWKLMNISNDRFIRTTDDYHCAAVQRIFKRMYDNGDIYKGAYKGKYCTPCESFWTESQLVDGKCPDCGREVKDAEEEAYFFRLSKYADRIRDLLENTDFLQPRSRVNEMVTYLHDLHNEIDIRIKSFGHAGDGNLHAYILKDDLSDEEWEKRMSAAMEKIYQKAHELEGQVSGEHGIGYAKKPYLRESLPEKNLDLMNGIKKVFDPKNILNPHKVAQR